MRSYTANNGRSMQVGDEAYEKASNVAKAPCLGSIPVSFVCVHDARVMYLCI